MNLQIPPDLHSPSLSDTNFVPLPRRKPADSKHQIALVIREGRRVASTLIEHNSKSSRSSRDTLPPTTMTTVSTVLEQDFTVEGKKGTLGCPFSIPVSEEAETKSSSQIQDPDHTPHHSSDPICAAMFEEETSQTAPSVQGAAKNCPIRYMNQHSPEEIAHYVETHKHELPRSHEVCLRRYQKNEDHIRKLDAKYGNLVNMVQGLSRIHQPMLPEQDTRPQSDVTATASVHRVEAWARTVSATVTDDPDATALEEDAVDGVDRRGHFDRPMNEVRVGESPSRPWGISVPIYDTPSTHGDSHGRSESPPPAPVNMPTSPVPQPETPNPQVKKCPFDHTKLKGTPFGMPKHQEESPEVLDNFPSHNPFSPITPAYPAAPPPAFTPKQPALQQPTFLNAEDLAKPPAGNTPQMLFTGPVFIGYPIEQAIQFMQHFQAQK